MKNFTALLKEIVLQRKFWLGKYFHERRRKKS
jgi:hypothetical protein